MSTGKFMEGTVATPDATFTLEFNDYLALHNNTVTMITLVEQVKHAIESAPMNFSMTNPIVIPGQIDRRRQHEFG